MEQNWLLENVWNNFRYLSIIYHLYGACCNCVFLLKVWWKCPSGSPAHAWCSRWCSCDFLSLTPWSLNFKGWFWPLLEFTIHYHRKLKPGVRFSLFLIPETLDEEAAVVVSEGFRDYILNQLKTKTSFDFENNRASKGATQSRTD